MSSPPAALRQQALRWLAQREHSRQELQGKLQRWLSRQHPGDQPEGVDPDSLVSCIDVTLDALEAAGWLNAERFVESRLRQRQSRYGNRRIQAELRQHGLQANPEQQAQLAFSEADRALHALTKRFGERQGAHIAPLGSLEPLARVADSTEAPQAQGRPGTPSPALRERLKHHRFLAARGFSPEAIQKAVRAHEQFVGSAADMHDAEDPDTAC